MAGWYEIAKNDKGQFFFVLKAANAQVILRSEQHLSKSAARDSVVWVQLNSPRNTRYELATSSDGHFYFNLKAANSQVIGTSQMYTSEGARRAGIESVKINGQGTDVREI